MKPKCVIKLGGAVITRSDDPAGLDQDVMQRLAGELATLSARMILVHGTGAVGKPPAIEHGFVGTAALPVDRAHLACDIHHRLRGLNQAVVASLLAAGIPAIGIDPGLLLNGDFNGWRASGCDAFLGDLLEHGVVPVVYGDMIPGPDGVFRVLSSDVIACRLAIELAADHLIFLSNVPGVFADGNGGEDGGILEEVDSATLANPGLFGGTDASDVSEGMGEKLRMAMDAARHCQSCWIGSGRTPGLVPKFLETGEVAGTRVRGN